jgi:hypothetical protein
MAHPATSCFLHIPKTGGSWVTAALRNSLPASDVCVVPSDRVGHVPLPVLLERFAVVAGHFTMAHVRPVIDATFTFTVLRDPIDRVISLFHFYRDQMAIAGHDPRVAEAQGVGFDDFVNRLDARVSPWSNWQTFVLSGASDCEKKADDLLPAAVANLRRVDLVGIHDDLAGSLSAFAAARGWHLTAPAARINATRGRVSLSALKPSTMRKLSALNAADIELFRAARERWVLFQTMANEPPPAAAAAAGPEPTTFEMGTKQIVITGARADSRSGTVVVSAHSFIDADDVTVGIRIRDAAGIVIYGINTRLLGQRIEIKAGHALEVVFRLNLQLAQGEYEVTAAVHKGADHLQGCYHWVERVARFVCYTPHKKHFVGIVDLNATAEARIATAGD